MCHKCGSRLPVIHVTTLYVKIQNVPIRIALWSYHTRRQRQNELSPLKKWVDDCTNLIYIQADEINYHFFSVFKLPKFLCTLDIHLGINLLHQSFFASHILTMHDNITPIQYNQKAIVWRMSVSLNAQARMEAQKLPLLPIPFLQQTSQSECHCHLSGPGCNSPQKLTPGLHWLVLSRLVSRRSYPYQPLKCQSGNNLPF